MFFSSKKMYLERKNVDFCAFFVEKFAHFVEM